MQQFKIDNSRKLVISMLFTIQGLWLLVNNKCFGWKSNLSFQRLLEKCGFTIETRRLKYFSACCICCHKSSVLI